MVDPFQAIPGEGKGRMPADIVRGFQIGLFDETIFNCRSIKELLFIDQPGVGWS